MPLSVWIGTRKGLFLASRDAHGWTLAEPSFLGDPVTMVLDDPGTGDVYAALNLGHFGVKLHRSADRGSSWEERAVPSFAFAVSEGERGGGAAADERANAPALQLIWALEAGAPDALWAGTIPGGLFVSRDRGFSWEPIRSLWDLPARREWFGGGYDHPGIHSILVDPRDPSRVIVAVSCGGAWLTTDAGLTWQNRSRGMRAAYMPPEQSGNPNVQDPHRMVACPGVPDALWTQHHNGVFRSTDGGADWQEITTARPSSFGFAVAAHPRDPDTAWFVPAVKDERRVPVDAALVVSRTRDGGNTFDVLDRGLPSPSYDLVYRHGLDVDHSGDVLALGSTTGGFWVSEDGGESWQTVSVHLPPIYCVRFSASEDAFSVR